MVASLRRGVALGLIVVASFLASGLANAQPKPVSDSTDFIRGQDYVSTETGIPFFFEDTAQLVDAAIKKMRDAADKCEREAYDNANAAFVSLSIRFPEEKNAPQAAKRSRDRANVKIALERAPRFPISCKPPGTAAAPRQPFSVFLIGGAQVPLNGGGAVTGVDTFFGPGSFLIDNRQTGVVSNSVPVFGARARVSTEFYALIQKMRELRITSSSDSPGVPGPQVFFETGIQSAFGAQSFIQPFSGVNTTPQGYGSNKVTENFQIPILIGVGVPLTSGGRTPVFFDGYGGVTLSNSTQTLQGAESGAPGARGFFAAQTNTTADPTVGVGLRAVFNNLSSGGIAFPPIIIGVNAELSFRPGSVVQAQSSAFPSEFYYGTVNPRTNGSLMFRFGFPFGALH